MAGKVIGCSAVAWFVLSGSAFAQAPGDPDPSGPPGRVYELPVDAGRRDAAPRDRGGDGGVPGSSYRSENNFGTSAIVPGAPRTEPSADANGGDGGAAGPGTGGAGDQGAGDQGSGAALTAAAIDTGDTSSTKNHLLLALIAVGGILLGVTSARVRPGA